MQQTKTIKKENDRKERNEEQEKKMRFDKLKKRNLPQKARCIHSKAKEHYYLILHKQPVLQIQEIKLLYR